jgi:hypothetical protein
MSGALLSVLLVCNRRIGTQTSREIQQHVMFILTGPLSRHLSDGNQTVRPTLKKINHGFLLCQNNVHGV